MEYIFLVIQGFIFSLIIFFNQLWISTNNQSTYDSQLIQTTTAMIQESSSSAAPPSRVTKNPTPNSESQGQENFVAEPDPEVEGLYIIKNVIPETMTTVDELNQAVNAYRQTHGLNQLSIDPNLCSVAAQRAIEASQEFSHDLFSSHVENGDYNYVNFSRIGENLSQGSLSGVHIVEFGWDKSPSHRANMHESWQRGCGGVHETTAAFIFAE